MNEAYLNTIDALAEEFLELNREGLTQADIENLFTAYDELGAIYHRQQIFEDYFD